MHSYTHFEHDQILEYFLIYQLEIKLSNCNCTNLHEVDALPLNGYVPIANIYMQQGEL